MTQEEFIKLLRTKGYSYEIEGDKILVTSQGSVDLRSLETLPPGVHFKNDGSVNLSSLETLPPGVEFKNEGSVDLSSLETLPPGVHFKNSGDVYLNELGWVRDIKGIMIEGVENKRLLHLMISKGLFV